jgi:hypothetical protein
MRAVKSQEMVALEGNGLILEGGAQRINRTTQQGRRNLNGTTGSQLQCRGRNGIKADDRAACHVSIGANGR